MNWPLLIISIVFWIGMASPLGRLVAHFIMVPAKVLYGLAALNAICILLFGKRHRGTL